LEINREVLGKILVAQTEHGLAAGRIVEVEAYRHRDDAGSHASGGRRTKRTEVMYASGGVAYVYLIYGMYRLFNIVTNRQDLPDAVLVRAVEPLEGIAGMLERRKQRSSSPALTAGPGRLSQALGIDLHHYGTSLLGPEIWLEDDGTTYSEQEIIRSPRVNIDYAGEDALLPWRLRVKDSKWTSLPR